LTLFFPLKLCFLSKFLLFLSHSLLSGIKLSPFALEYPFACYFMRQNIFKMEFSVAALSAIHHPHFFKCNMLRNIKNFLSFYLSNCLLIDPLWWLAELSIHSRSAFLFFLIIFGTIIFLKIINGFKFPLQVLFDLGPQCNRFYSPFIEHKITLGI